MALADGPGLKKGRPHVAYALIQTPLEMLTDSL